eukprot:3643066-Amphidinium_carterae.2
MASPQHVSIHDCAQCNDNDGRGSSFSPPWLLPRVVAAPMDRAVRDRSVTYWRWSNSCGGSDQSSSDAIGGATMDAGYQRQPGGRLLPSVRLSRPPVFALRFLWRKYHLLTSP